MERCSWLIDHYEQVTVRNILDEIVDKFELTLSRIIPVATSVSQTIFGGQFTVPTIS